MHRYERQAGNFKPPVLYVTLALVHVCISTLIQFSFCMANKNCILRFSHPGAKDAPRRVVRYLCVAQALEIFNVRPDHSLARSLTCYDFEKESHSLNFFTFRHGRSGNFVRSVFNYRCNVRWCSYRYTAKRFNTFRWSRDAMALQLYDPKARADCEYPDDSPDIQATL